MKKIITMSLAGALLLASGCANKPTGSNAGATGSLKDGAYTAAKPGMNADVEVEVKIANGKIDAVTVTGNEETPGIGGELVNAKGEVKTNGGESPITLIPKRIVEGQSIKVDSVTGATITMLLGMQLNRLAETRMISRQK